MFHITFIRAERPERGMTRLSAARFVVHCFAAHASVNSALHCSTLDAECAQLWKSRCARHNTLFTVARRACAITTSNCQGISFSAPRLLVASAVDGFGFSLFGFSLFGFSLFGFSLFGFSLFGFSRERLATLVYSVVTFLMKMQLSHKHLHVRDCGCSVAIRQPPTRAPSSHGVPREVPRPGAEHVSGFAAPLFSERPGPRKF